MDIKEVKLDFDEHLHIFIKMGRKCLAVMMIKSKSIWVGVNSYSFIGTKTINE